MSRAADSPTHDDPAALLTPTLDPRPLTGETVTVEASHDQLADALVALSALAASEEPTPSGRATVAAIEERVRTRLDRLDACDRDRLLVRFDAADVVVLALAHLSLARSHGAADESDRAERFLDGARGWLGRLGSQRPTLVDALARVD